ncbi:MAG: glucose-6-phosphate dehydrogenase assembly protein OpcA [Thermomicrobiales bacterium]|nr:glucose-6-phosphate dehydrogenase assembly protein OpcA [Thermomicrobiales bacterium]
MAGRTKTAAGNGLAVAGDRQVSIEARSFKREESWQAETIDANAVHKTFQRLWNELADERLEALGRPRRDPDAALMRTRTINLIGIADDTVVADRINDTVTSLVEFVPSRSMILVRQPPATLRTGLGVRVVVEERRSSRNRTPIRFETITVAAAGREELLASVASPVLLPELPDFVWYPTGTFSESRLLKEVLAITDRLIVDTASVDDPSTSLRFLASLEAGASDGKLHLSDTVWTRLMPWRQMIAQFFDQGAAQLCLDSIDDVTITYGGRDAAGRSGLTAGLLMAGWLCTRLGWRAPGEELVRARGGWRLTLRAGQRGRSREVILMLKEVDPATSGPCLGEVTIEARGENAGRFHVERVSPESIETTSELASNVSRVVYVRNLDDARLLSLELRVFGSDPVYHEALNFAANLWPEGVPIS